MFMVWYATIYTAKSSGFFFFFLQGKRVLDFFFFLWKQKKMERGVSRFNHYINSRNYFLYAQLGIQYKRFWHS